MDVSDTCTTCVFFVALFSCISPKQTKCILCEWLFDNASKQNAFMRMANPYGVMLYKYLVSDSVLPGVDLRAHQHGGMP